MADYVGQIILGLGSAVATILGATALLIRARASASKPKNLLERLWDWIEGENLTTEVPPTLRAAVERELGDGKSDGDNP